MKILVAVLITLSILVGLVDPSRASYSEALRKAIAHGSS